MTKPQLFEKVSYINFLCFLNLTLLWYNYTGSYALLLFGKRKELSFETPVYDFSDFELSASLF